MFKNFRENFGDKDAVFAIFSGLIGGGTIFYFLGSWPLVIPGALLGLLFVFVGYLLMGFVLNSLEKKGKTFIKPKAVVSRSRYIQVLDREMINRQERLKGSEPLESEIDTDRMLAVKTEELSRLDD